MQQKCQKCSFHSLIRNNLLLCFNFLWRPSSAERRQASWKLNWRWNLVSGNPTRRCRDSLSHTSHTKEWLWSWIIGLLVKNVRHYFGIKYKPPVADFVILLFLSVSTYFWRKILYWSNGCQNVCSSEYSMERRNVPYFESLEYLTCFLYYFRCRRHSVTESVLEHGVELHWERRLGLFGFSCLAFSDAINSCEMG